MNRETERIMQKLHRIAYGDSALVIQAMDETADGKVARLEDIVAFILAHRRHGVSSI